MSLTRLRSPPVAPPSARLRLRVSAAAESRLRAGHPWMYAESIREQNRQGQLGELAVVYDRKDQFLAIGLFDPTSPIRLRVLHAGRPRKIDAAWWAGRFDSKVIQREGWFDRRTSGYRLLNGESEGWPGLVLDRYGAVLVLKLYTAAWLPRLKDLAALILARLRPEGLVLRLSRNIQTAAAQFQMEDGQVLHGPAISAPVIFLENGLRFEADALRGQKTGFFLDQRENRRRIEGYSSGRAVLNAFSYSGGFALYAARGGAKSVTNVDISAHALAGAERNFSLNAAEPAVVCCRREMARADAFEWLSGNKRMFDLVVLDPPSLAKREAERVAAIRAYSKLASLGIKLLSPGGILLACSCSAHVSKEEFFGAVRRSASESRRRVEELQTSGHPPDHPATFKEAEYLKAIYLRLS